jgi:hypothetical protein
MLIPLGVLSAAGAGEPVALSDYELIATGNATGSAAFIEFTSIPTTYSHLQIRGTFRGTDSASVRDFLITMNGIAGTSYASHQLNGNGSTVSSSGLTSQARIEFSNIIPAATQTANIFGACVIDVLDYRSTSKNTTIRMLGGFSGTSQVIRLGSGFVNNTAAITTIRLAVNVANLATGTRFSLYGIKG